MASANTWVRKALDLSKLPRIKLNTLQDLPGAKQKLQRVGRGPGSGRGKTCGRGHKGQGQRNKKAIRVGFEGGQTPFYRTVPKHGFKNKDRKEYEPLNLGWLQYLIDTGRVNDKEPITMNMLKQAGAIGKIKHGIKLLADGVDRFKANIDIEVSKASQSAIEAVESAGGTVTTSYYNPVALRAHLFPEKYEQDPLRVFPRRALPKKKTMKYYLNPENRGYLLTDAGEERLKQGGMKGAYLGKDNRIHIPGKRVTLYSSPSPSKEEAFKEDTDDE